ncbi:hypothetical protein MNEG_4110 [Monoraphidium neglectum]|uniref:DNA2/NAM7 helicase helicase domain-containing protein n=1 Tax=Monoraphidium neglectum TaxID=145388 RepID=A0A0D2LAM8_9CHLO|nr:hypothetical protein MNEG_4110 [Monoraphidium neglectum]KIZ03844.1 hypothetical protein MNEG_4110 [Monoraphidium neglectum]|eukprot:XP_013902863.1 hypothetical protein MNEG_4110 [Monoraphidium neglectum]
MATVLLNPLTLLHGPPGTGKTTTICGLIYYLRRTWGHRGTILVTAQSNIAVDNVLERSLAEFESHGQWHNAIHFAYLTAARSACCHLPPCCGLDVSPIDGLHIVRIGEPVRACLVTPASNASPI